MRSGNYTSDTGSVSASNATSGQEKRSRGRPRKIKSKIPIGTGPASDVSPFGDQKEGEGGGVVQSLAHRVYIELLKGIDSGRYAPGERVKASEIASALGLSRAPVREALHIFAGQGLLEMRQDKGAFMREFSIYDLIDIYEVAGAASIVGMEAAARLIDSADNRQQIETAIGRILQLADIESPLEMYSRLIAFHRVANSVGQKPHVSHTLRTLNLDYWHRFLVEIIDVATHKPRYINNYRRLADAILAGDDYAAGAVMRSHSMWSMTILREGWEQQFGPLK